MKRLKNSLDCVNVLGYLTMFFCFLIFNMLEKSVLPYSTAVLTSALALNASPFTSAILYLLSFLVLGEVGLLASSGITAVVMITVTFIYKKTSIKIGVGFATYTLIALSGFIILGNTAVQILFTKRLITVAVTLVLSFITLVAGKAISEKGLKFKLGVEEVLCIFLSVSLFGLGTCNLISPHVWKGVSVLLVLVVCYLFKTGTATVFSCSLGASLAVFYANIDYVSTFLVLALCAESLMRLSRFASAPLVAVADYCCYLLFGTYSVYTLTEFLPVFIAMAVFVLVPTKPLNALKERLYAFRERQLVRQTINRNRLFLSNKLYELSSVFTEMANSFNLFKENALTEDKAKATMETQIYTSVCRDCENYPRCKKSERTIKSALNRMIDIGFAKGKLSLIDLPRDLSLNCVHPNNILYGLNKLLQDFRTYRLDSQNVKTGRDLVASEAQGIAEVLRSLALDTGATLKYQSRLERKLSDNLFKAGFTVTEILIYGENERTSVGLIICMREFSHTALQKIISKTLNMDMLLSDKADITQDKCYLVFTRATEYDAVFGISKATKDNSEKSGDTHSVTRISGDRFLVALSDGMGSGEKAETVSSACLSLIECFYKAGLNSNLILSTVNTLLAINTEDSFSALDVSVIDLKNCTADFIKYGCPYGFIINDNGIRIVQGNTLPLGIIDELKPSVCSTQLENGDMVLLVTDGVSDAFGSSDEVIEFLRTLPAKNPQTLTDQILEKAIAYTNGKKNDDMTALAVRIYKRVG